MMCLFAALTMTVLGFNGLTAQNLPDSHQKIMQMIDTRNYSAAIDELQRLRDSHAKAFVAVDYDYLLARVAERDGRLGLAMSSYQSVAKRNADLRFYAFKHMSGVARSSGNLMLERIYLTEILLSSPKSVLAGGAVYRLARNSFEQGNYGATIRMLTTNSGALRNQTSPQTADEHFVRETRALLGEAYLRDGQSELARDIFSNLIESDPKPAQPDDFSLIAVRAMDLMDGGSVQKAPGLAEDEHLRRAQVYQFSREFKSGRLHFEALIIGYPNGSNSADAMFQIGRGYAQQSNFAEALKWYERLLERYASSVAAKEALLNSASAYARFGKSKEAISRYQAFMEKYPADEKLDRAFLNIVDVYRDQDSDSEAIKWCAKTRKAFAGKLPAALALFAEARIYVSKEDWQNALERLDQLEPAPNLGGATVPGGTNGGEIDFLRAFALEQSKRYAEAIDAYLSIPDGRGEYYGWRATERLKSLSTNEASSSFIARKTVLLATKLDYKESDERRETAQALLRLTDVPAVRVSALEALRADIKALPRYQGIPNLKPVERAGSPHSIGDALVTLGLYDEAASEIDADTTRSGEAAFDRALRHTRGGRADLGLAFIEPIWRKVPADYPIELIPREHAELLYPAPFADELLRYAPERGVDPRLVLAIMRQESRFQPDAKSYAAARGLMQFISTTSTQVAGELGRDRFDQENLYYPPTAVLFGAQYLAGLFRMFPNQPDAVVASYNGGEENMKRWLARSRSNLPERYVPEIAYSQTKDYVYKVMANYRMYQILYDEQLRPR